MIFKKYIKPLITTFLSYPVTIFDRIFLPGFIDISGQVAESCDKLHIVEMAVNDGEIKFVK